jgi:hypothetical protein
VAVFFFSGEKSPKANTDPNFGRKMLLCVAKFRPVLTFGGRTGGGMGGECVATGLSIGYTFNGPVQNCRQLSGNLPCEARHCSYKLQNWQQSQEIR